MGTIQMSADTGTTPFNTNLAVPEVSSPVQRLHCALKGGGSVGDLLGALTEGADPNKRAKGERHRPIVWAAVNKRYDLLECLIQAGANVHVSDDLPLRIAIDKNDVPTARVLLVAGADVHVQDDMLLGRAIVGGSPELVSLLLSHGAEPNCGQRSYFRFDFKQTPLDKIRACAASGASLYEGRQNPLLLARNNREMLCALLRAGASPEKAFKVPNRKNLCERAWCIWEKLELCKALRELATVEQCWAAFRLEWLASFEAALNSWQLARGEGSEAYNQTLMEIHYAFGHLASPGLDHLPPLRLTLARI